MGPDLRFHHSFDGQPVRRPRGRRRAGRASAALAAVALVAAACGTSSSRGTTGQASSQGHKSGSSGSSTKTVVVGLSEMMSGPLSSYGSVRFGSLAAFKYLNAAGGINGYTFKPIVVDNAYNGAQTVSGARTLVEQDHAMALNVIGTTPAEAMRNTAPGLSAVTIAGGDGELALPPTKNYFLLAPDYRTKSSILIQYFVQKLGLKQFSVAYENDGIGIPVNETASKYGQQYGAQDVGGVAIPATTTDFAPFAAKLKSKSAPVVLAGLGTTVLAGLQKACVAIGYHPKWFTDWAALGGGYPSIVGPTILNSGVYAANYEQPLANSPAATLYKTQVNKYYPGQATPLNQLGWDAAMIIAEAVKAATANGGPLTVSSLEAGLYRLSTVSVGTMLNVSFTTADPVASHAMTIYEYQNGAPVPVTGVQNLAPLPPGTPPALKA